MTIQTNNFQNSNNETAQNYEGAEIGTLNNFYSLKIIKPYKGKIENRKVHKNVLNWSNIAPLFFLSLIGSLSSASIIVAIPKIYFSKNFEIYDLSLFTLIFSIIILIIIILTLTKRWYFSGLQISINENEIVLHEKSGDKKINFSNIRSYLKMSDLIGYSIYVYHENKIFPYIEFSVQSVHMANAIEELLLNKIQDSSSSPKTQL
ncbi:MAG: hypothetical protein PHX44_08205 [Sulfurimonas sp.]|uniref:hypothetical protein n=1 Tax=Sulfurimonas sp. TaxID=2022749 RepID=UPI00261E8D85|nr:hypothetical protein [Sulfurimonas sp.]MDD2653016.1 hypothetical protein [Sulfurimonas sp.]MDD3452462.1 hypothetical protein [Sulfurimonas sp.]